jgi:hypothetical protein
MHTPSSANAISEQFEVGVPGSTATSVPAILSQPALWSWMSDAGWEQSRLNSTEVVTVNWFKLFTDSATSRLTASPFTALRSS